MSAGWVKVKTFCHVEAAIRGWLPGEGHRGGRIGGAVVGLYDDSTLKYAGRVGTGFTEAELKRLGELLKPLPRDTRPFEGRRPPKESRFRRARARVKRRVR